MWMAMPEGISAVSPGASASGSFRQARRSMPAEPAVACCGRGNSLPMRGSSSFTLTICMSLLLVTLADYLHETARDLKLGGIGQFLLATLPIQRQRIIIGIETFALAHQV